MRYYNVKFNDSPRQYTFKAIFPYHIGEEVMCDTQGNTIYGTIVSEVTDPAKTKIATRYILSTREEAHEVEAQDLYAKMDSRIAQMDKIDIFERVAATDATMRLLWQRYRHVTGRDDQ